MHVATANKWKSKISIARNVEWDETDFDNTVIHEMVHLYLDIYDPRYRGKNLLYNRSHGRLFKQEARRLKEKYGIDIISKPHSQFIPPKNKKKYSNTGLTEKAIGLIKENVSGKLDSVMVVVSFKEGNELKMEDLDGMGACFLRLANENVDVVWGLQQVDDITNNRQVTAFAFEQPLPD